MEISVSQKVPANAGKIPPSCIQFRGAVNKNSQLKTLPPKENILTKKIHKAKIVITTNMLRKQFPQKFKTFLFFIFYPF